MIQYYIIDDNVFHREHLKNKLRQFKAGKDIVEIYSMKRINELLNQDYIHDGDVFFIDIDLKLNMDGIELAEKIREKNEKCHIVFFTANSTLGIGIDIINKNIYPLGYIKKENSLEVELNKILQQIEKKENDIDKIDRVVIKKNGIVTVLYPKEIAYIEGIKNIRNKVIIKNPKKDTVLNVSLKDIKKEFGSKEGYLILKSYCINLNQIVNIDMINFIVTFSGGVILIVGRKIAEKIRGELLKEKTSEN